MVDQELGGYIKALLLINWEQQLYGYKQDKNQLLYCT